MATVSSVNGLQAGTHPSRGIRSLPYVVENLVNFATATTTKGSALAASDVIQCISVPAQTAVLAAGYEVIATATGDVLLSVGTTQLATAFVSSQALTGSTAVGAYPTPSATAYPAVFGASAGTVDITISTSTTTLSAGTVRVWAILCDVQDRREGAGLSADRDQLA